jgi:prophage regulatory protein
VSADRLLRLPETSAKIGGQRSLIYGKLNPKSPQFDPTFPQPVRIGARAIAFSERELDEWIAVRKAARDERKAAMP